VALRGATTKWETRMMIERVAVLLGTVQYRLKVKVVVPEKAPLEGAEKAAWG
jgi:hypothetical protein